LKGKVLFFLLGGALALPVASQTPATQLVTHVVDETKLVTLRGSVHPLARISSDRGAVSDSFPASRLILLLNRPPEREAALQQFLQDAHTRSSASYHKWLTPEQFGAQFGPSDADIQTAAGWLSSHGLQVAKTSKSRQFIEFSGTAGQLREAFHTAIHQYDVEGETHYANATDVRIPAALAALVKGVSPMNDFRAKPQVMVAGKALYSRSTRKTTPQWTIPNPYGTSNSYAYPVTPEDFATQYDLGPLYKAGVNGTGQTIGIINESNIDLSLVQAYQKLFGVAGSMPQMVIDGDDPGILAGVDVEAYLDVEVSGAVAPKATVNLYIAEGSSLQDPLELAALRAVEDNQASVLSVSFGMCEFFMGNAGNQFWSELWEQAAAQGQTVFVSAGDSGSECSIEEENTVSGLASTPWNIAVGGTDFYYSDYATGGASVTSLWNTTNDANLGSLIAPLPEQPWDDPYGLNVVSDGYKRSEYGAGGGGASNCITQDATTGVCTSGYAKPGWQTGPGVPADASRDLPDVSLFASNGANLSAYAICAYEGECAAGAGDHVEFVLVGGTSASSPAMAGIMALVNQKYGRQGQANYTLYPLAQQKQAAFHDITVGSNSEVCGGVADPPICVLQWNGIYGTPQYPAGAGYDQASGLGSVDANALVNNWNAITFQPTKTTLQLSSTTIAHGTSVTATASVVPSSGSGTPTGDVAILTSSTLPANQTEGYITLSAGTGDAMMNYLPGGEYLVTARYGGDGAFASSTSTAETLTVTQEKTNINFAMGIGTTGIASGGSVAYAAPLTLYIQPTGVSAASGTTNGNATGTATFTIDSTTATVALNGSGFANWNPPALAVGTHTASASYSGDASFAATAATPITFSVTPGTVFMSGFLIGLYTYQLAPDGETLPAYYMNPGSSLTVGVTAQGSYTWGANPSQIPLGTTAPTGTVQVCLGTDASVTAICMSPVYSQTATLAPLSGTSATKSLGVVTFPNLAAGSYILTAAYSGDSNWHTWGLFDDTFINVQTLPVYAPTTTTLSITPTSISGTQAATVTATVTGAGNTGTSPTGELDFYDNDVLITYCYWYPRDAVTGTTTTCSFEVTPAWFNQNGANQLTAKYWGDGANGPSVSNTVNFTSSPTIGDFTFAPQTPQVTVQAGSSGTVLLNLQSLSNFNGAVALTCTPASSQITCSIPATVTLIGQATATLTVNAAAKTTALVTPRQQGSIHWPIAMGVLFLGFLFAGGRAGSKFRRSLMLGLCLFAAMLASSCGGGISNSSSTSTSTTATAPDTYSVLVTGTANGIVHNARITVMVP
jgi:subtilase family serine protease